MRPATAAIERPATRASREIRLVIACVPKPICYTPNPCRLAGRACADRAMRACLSALFWFQRVRRASVSAGYEWT